MPRETLDLGSTPVDEPCAQTIDPNYELRALVECEAFKKQLQRTLEAQFASSQGVKLRVKSSSHDFGLYYEVWASYDPTDKNAVEAAFWLENNVPTHWDAAARMEIASQLVDWV